MFNSLKKYKKIIIGAVVLVGLFFLYNTFLAGGDDEALLVSESVDGATNEVNRDLLASLLQIRSIRLDESIFDDRGLRALEDFTQEVVPQPVGRPNPFLPIGTDPEEPEEPEETIGEESSLPDVSGDEGETATSSEEEPGN